MAMKRNLSQCKECKLWYQEKAMAKKCEAWCKKYKSCNIEFIRQAVNPDDH